MAKAERASTGPRPATTLDSTRAFKYATVLLLILISVFVSGYAAHQELAARSQEIKTLAKNNFETETVISTQTVLTSSSASSNSETSSALKI